METQSDSPTLRKRGNPSHPQENPPPYDNLYPSPSIEELPSKKTDGAAGPPPPQSHVQYGPDRQRIICAHCHAEIMTELRPTPTTKTHLAALLFCLLCWPCAWIPYCVDSCQNLNHYCPNCDAFLGTYES